jgi:hypothetical protein
MPSEAALLLAGKSLNNFTQVLLSDVTDTLRLLMILVWLWLQTDRERDRQKDRQRASSCNNQASFLIIGGRM